MYAIDWTGECYTFDFLTDSYYTFTATVAATTN